MSATDNFPFKNSKMATFLTKALEALPPTRTLMSVAVEAGFLSPDILQMFCDGSARVALDKVPALAKAINVDPSLLFALAVEQFMPSLAEFITDAFGRTVSVNEYRLVKTLRELTHNTDPEFGPAMAAKLVQVLHGGGATTWDRQ